MSTQQSDPPTSSSASRQAIAFEDLSGIVTTEGANPYDALIDACHNDPAQIQARYAHHRTTRNAQQRALLLSPSFPGVTIDPILRKLVRNGEGEEGYGYEDPRHCLVFWVRPPRRVMELVGRVQGMLREGVPNLWLMPPANLHMTALEITHSLTAPQIDAILRRLEPHLEHITDYTYSHRARLIKPMLGYDGQAVALSFLPAAAAGDGGSGGGGGRSGDAEEGKDADGYTYHHLRRDLWAAISDIEGVEVQSRYTVPSAHLTVARFVAAEDFAVAGAAGSDKLDQAKMRAWVEKLEDVNRWLREEFWPSEERTAKVSGDEWVVGEEKGLDCRAGTLWYGGGKTVRLGRGF